MKKLVIPILLLAFSFSIHAQRGDKMKEIKAQKVAFITNQLNLTVEESQQFWPIYNAFEAKVHDMRRNDLKDVREAMENDDLSDNEAQKLLDKFMTVEDKMHEAKKQLVRDLSNVLPAKKIIALKATEDAFNRKLMSIMQKRREKMQEMRQNRKN